MARRGGIVVGMFRMTRVAPGDAPDLAGRDPGSHLGLADKKSAQEQLPELVAEIGKLHARLSAEATRSTLLILQGFDASGKDGTIRSVLTGIDPQGCRVVSFKEPTTTDLAHDYLWRIHAECPARGEIGIFNRSHYEDIVTVRARKLAPPAVWKRRPAQVNAFEQLLTAEGTAIVKVFLHVSKDEQRRRLQERIDDPEKGWKLRRSDLEDHARYDRLLALYEETIEATSTDWAPWHIVPADHNWVRNTVVAGLLVDVLRGLDPQLPPRPPELADAALDG